MKNQTYKKKTNVGKLTEELRDQGVDVIGVSGCDDETIVHLHDDDMSDTSQIVENHEYKEEDEPQELSFDEKVENVLKKYNVIPNDQTS